MNKNRDANPAKGTVSSRMIFLNPNCSKIANARDKIKYKI